MATSSIRLSDGRTIVIRSEEYEVPDGDDSMYTRTVLGQPHATIDGTEITMEEARRLVEADEESAG